RKEKEKSRKDDCHEQSAISKACKKMHRVEKLPVKVRHVDAHVPKSRANEEHWNNEQVDQAAKIEVSKIDLDWEHKEELFLAEWAHDASGHQGRDATYKWARHQGVDLTMDSVSQIIHDCDTCAAIKQAKGVKPLWYGRRWSKSTSFIMMPMDKAEIPDASKSHGTILSIFTFREDFKCQIDLLGEVQVRLQSKSPVAAMGNGGGQPAAMEMRDAKGADCKG
ncbi:hypothetical protein HGM15179_003220, partial [Zosterops borbonicus]